MKLFMTEGWLWRAVRTWADWEEGQGCLRAAGPEKVIGEGRATSQDQGVNQMPGSHNRRAWDGTRKLGMFISCKASFRFFFFKKKKKSPCYNANLVPQKEGGEREANDRIFLEETENTQERKYSNSSQHWKFINQTISRLLASVLGDLGRESDMTVCRPRERDLEGRLLHWEAPWNSHSSGFMTDLGPSAQWYWEVRVEEGKAGV